MRVTIQTALLLLVICWCADGWGSRRILSRVSSGLRRSLTTIRSTVRRIRLPTTVRLASPLGRTVIQANVGHSSLSAGITHHGKGWSGSVTGSIGTNSNFGVKAGITIPIGKRSVQNGNLYNLTLYVDPCNFDTYDDDRDGLIQKEELQAIFGDNENTDALFADLDIVTGDGVIEQEEFHAVVPVTISACAIKED